MTEANSYICRTCLTHTQKDDCKSLQSDEEVKPFATIREMLTDVISNINLDITENPVICIPCYKDLRTAVDFKLKCLRTETAIKNCLSGNSGFVNLSDVFNINNDSKNVIQPEKKEEVIVIHVDTGAENDNESHHTAADILREIKDENCGPQSNQNSNVLQQQENSDDFLPNECTACCITLPSYEALEFHARNDHQIEELYNCKVCRNIFTNPLRAQDHALQHIGSGKYSCEDMIRILPFYLNGTPKTCPECFNSFLWFCQFKQKPSQLCCKCLGHRGTFSVVFERIAELDMKKKDILQVIEISRFPCTLCSKSFLFEHDLENHKQSHKAKIRRYTCGECGKKFSRKPTLADHIEIVHKGLGTLRCPKCGRCYSKRDSYDRHMRSHEGEVFSICEICGKNFMSNGDLTKHIRRHMGDKKHQCPICGKLFVMRYAMKEHERTHDKKTSSSKCVCEVCGKVLSSTNSFMIHKTKFCGIKRYKCDMCDKSFKFKRYLQSHIEDHKQVQKHKCSICKLNYSSWLALRKHQRVRHKIYYGTAKLQPTEELETEVVEENV